jgi:hypothetical protein
MLLRISTMLPAALHLDRVLTQLETLTPGSHEAEAAKRMLARWAGTQEALAGESYSERHARASALIGRKRRAPSGAVYFRAAHALQEYESRIYELNDLYFSLVALASLVAERRREEVLSSLADEEWYVKHEVLVRRAWMEAHRDLIAKNVALELPFGCVVAERGRRERGGDREFNTLLRFLHGLRAATGEELLFVSKSPTSLRPDFTVADVSGSVFGIEVSDVPPTVEGGFEQDKEKEVVDSLSVLESAGIRVVIHEPPSWQEIAKDMAALTRWRDTDLLSAARSGMRISVPYALGLCVEVEPCAPPYTVISSFKGGQEVENAELAFGASLYESVRKKLFKNGRTRPRPEVKPCYLALYAAAPLYDFGLAVRRFQERFDLDISDYFSQVWLVSDAMVRRIV